MVGSFEPETVALAVAIAALAGVIRGITGFGGAMVMSPPFALLLGPLMTVPVAAKRLAFILGCGLAWDTGQLARTLLLLPLLAPGLIAWASGFRRGLATAQPGPR